MQKGAWALAGFLEVHVVLVLFTLLAFRIISCLHSCELCGCFTCEIRNHLVRFIMLLHTLFSLIYVSFNS